MLGLTINPGCLVKIGPDITIVNKGQEPMHIAIAAPKTLRIERVDPRKILSK
jgi:sRNA-binding carbon storage regulator CsrA